MTQKKYDQCDGERAAQKRLIDTYSSQLSSQQTQLSNQQQTINTCVVVLAKANAPEQQRFTTFLNTVDPTKGTRILQLIVATNKPISPVNLMLECNANFTNYDYQIVRSNGVEYNGPPIRPDQRRGQVYITSPPWTPMNPLVITVYSNQSSLSTCELSSL